MSAPRPKVKKNLAHAATGDPFDFAGRYGSVRQLMKPASLLFSLLTAANAFAADWPRYRGTNFDGISTEKGWSATWPTEGPKQLWTAVLGPGGSSVIVRDGRLYTMGNVKDQDIVYCLDAETGKEIWRHAYACPLDKRSFEGGPAGTPTLDGALVFTMSHKGDVFALAADTGRVAWSKNVMQEYKGKRPQWGYACTPTVLGDAVILDVGGPGASTVALDKRTGKELWKAGNDGASYSSAVPWNWNGKAGLLIFKARALVALDAANGAELWRFPWKTDWDVHSAFPIPAGEHVFLSSGYKRGAALLKMSATGPQAVWENQNMCNQMNGSVLIGGHLYGVSGDSGSQAKLNCVTLATGELNWSEKGLGCGSVMAADGKLIVLSEKGELVIAEASPAGFKPLARAQVLSGRCWVVPVLANGRIYCRSNLGTLVALDVRPGNAAPTPPGKTASFAADFENAAVDKLPAEFVTEREIVVKEDAGNRFLQFPDAPAEPMNAQFGPVVKTGVAGARASGLKKGRLFPQFALGLGGLNGYRLQVSPGRKLVELLKGDEVKASAPVEWASEKWLHLRLQIREVKPGAWRIEGKTWLADATEPAEWTVAIDETAEPPMGRATLWSTPFSNTPIRFDDVAVKPL